MKAQREFLRVTLGRRMDVARLRAVLHQAMLEMAADPAPEAAPARLESVLIEPTETTVYVSGNGLGLKVLATALQGHFSGVEISRARRADAMRLPAALESRASRARRKPRRK